MGLDQYGWVVTGKGENEREEIAYWRKHNRLQGWMENLWEDRKRQKEESKDLGDKFIDALSEPEYEGEFNCKDLFLTEEDLDRLEADVKSQSLPATEGFFYGSDSQGYYDEQDLEFIARAREALAAGHEVAYSCWW